MADPVPWDPTRWETSGIKPRRSMSTEGRLALVELAFSVAISAAVGLKYLSDKLAERTFHQDFPDAPPLVPVDMRGPDAFTWSDYIPVAITASVCVLLTSACTVLALWPADRMPPRRSKIQLVRLLLVAGALAICVLLALVPRVFR